MLTFEAVQCQTCCKLHKLDSAGYIRINGSIENGPDKIFEGDVCFCRKYSCLSPYLKFMIPEGVSTYSQKTGPMDMGFANGAPKQHFERPAKVLIPRLNYNTDNMSDITGVDT